MPAEQHRVAADRISVSPEKDLFAHRGGFAPPSSTRIRGTRALLAPEGEMELL